MANRISVAIAGQELSALVSGSPAHTAMILLHGWPLSSAIWTPLIDDLARDFFVLAFDLPGVGQSAGNNVPTQKTDIANIVISAAEQIGAQDIIVAGVDVGGMIAFSAARDHGDRIRSAVIMNTVIPGLDPWEEILSNPQIWHFAFHQTPRLPELLVTGREREYFDFFFDFLAGDKHRIDEDMRAAMTSAYARPEALATGFDWYRTLPRDAEHNQSPARIETPILYLRGDADHRPIGPYVDGLRKGGALDVISKVIPDSGEILSVEAPDVLVDALRDFASEKVPAELA